MIIKINFWLFLKKILMFLKTSIPPEQLNWDIYLLVKRTSMEWEAMSAPDLVSLVNQLSHTADESLQHYLHLLQIKSSKWNQNPSSFCYYCREPEHWETDYYKFQHFRQLLPSSQSFQSPSNSQLQGSQDLQGIFSILPLNWLRETLINIKDETFLVLVTIESHSSCSMSLL